MRAHEGGLHEATLILFDKIFPKNVCNLKKAIYGL